MALAKGIIRTLKELDVSYGYMRATLRHFFTSLPRALGERHPCLRSVTSLVAARQLVGVAAGHGHLALIDHAAYAIAAAAGAGVAHEPAALVTLLEGGAGLAEQARRRGWGRVRGWVRLGLGVRA